MKSSLAAIFMISVMLSTTLPALAQASAAQQLVNGIAVIKVIAEWGGTWAAHSNRNL